MGLLSKAWAVWLLPGPLVGSADGRTKAKEDCGQVHRETGLFSGSVSGTTVCKSAMVAWAFLLKMALLSLGLHQGFATSYLDPKAATKALLLVDGCQIIVAVGEYV